MPEPENASPWRSPVPVWAALLAITTLGLGLRLYQLGAHGLWFDEIGVAMAMRAPSFAALIEQIRAHVMAMPLDYLVGWEFSANCRSEACLRLPTAIWGSFTIPVSYLLFRYLTNARTALPGALLVALSPLHLQYSQELRFYAALVFFYTLSVWLLLRALDKPHFGHWLLFTLAVTLGSYFHLYVALVFVNAWVWVLTVPTSRIEKLRRTRELAVSTLISGLCILPGFLYFHSTADLSLFSFAETLVNLLIGLGWLPILLFPLQAGMVWYPLSFFFQILGVHTLIKSRNIQISAWIAASLLQVILILLSNGFSHYAFRARQILWLTPLLCLLAAIGMLALDEKLFRALRDTSFPLKRSISSEAFVCITRWALLLLSMIVTYLSLQTVYRFEKSNRREISAALVEHWSSGQEIWFTPAWEVKYYGFYLNFLGHSEMQQALIGKDNLYQTQEKAPVCWVTDQTLGAKALDWLPHQGYHPISLTNHVTSDTQTLWCR